MTHRSIQIEKGVPGYASVNPNTNTAYISYTSSNFIIVINLEKGTIENKIQLISPGDISINDVTNKVYVSSAYGICEIDGVNNQYGTINIGLPHSDGNIDINPQTNLLYTTCFGHDILTVIDATSGAIADKIPVGKDPKGVAVHYESNRVYVANYGSRSISVIDSNKSNKLLDTMSISEYRENRVVGEWPSFVLVNQSANLLYVKVQVTTRAEGGPVTASSLLVIDMIHRKIINRRGTDTTEEGIALNSENTAIYIRNPSRNKLYVSDSKNNLLYEIDG